MGGRKRGKGEKEREEGVRRRRNGRGKEGVRGGGMKRKKGRNGGKRELKMKVLKQLRHHFYAE